MVVILMVTNHQQLEQPNANCRYGYFQFNLGGATSSVADIYCYDTNVNAEIYDDATSNVTKSINCDGVTQHILVQMDRI